MTQMLEHLPTTGWGVAALVLGGLIWIIVLLVRGRSTQQQINNAVNHRILGEPTLVAMVSEIHADHRQLRDDVTYIRTEVNGIQQWKASYAGSEFGNAADIGKVLQEVRDGISTCKTNITDLQKTAIENQTLIQRFGCPVRLQQSDNCLKNNPKSN
jgi:hypothetical protein